MDGRGKGGAKSIAVLLELRKAERLEDSDLEVLRFQSVSLTLPTTLASPILFPIDEIEIP